MVLTLGISNQAEDAVTLAFRKAVKHANAADFAVAESNQRLASPVQVGASLIKPSHANEVRAGVYQSGELLALLLDASAVSYVPKIHRQSIQTGVSSDFIPAIKIGLVSR